MGYFIAKTSFVVATIKGLKCHISSNGLSQKMNFFPVTVLTEKR